MEMPRIIRNASQVSVNSKYVAKFVVNAIWASVWLLAPGNSFNSVYCVKQHQNPKSNNKRIN